MSHVCDGRDESCASCAEIVHRREVVRSAMTLGDRLDDIKRAQIWTRLDRALDTAPARRLPWRPAGAFVACAAAAVACWIVVRRAPEPRTLVAPADATLSAHIGPHTRAELIGPARLELDGTPGDATRVRLRAGTLVAEFTGGPGRSLRIETAGAVVEIVGTLFSVEVAGDATCISVAHGKVAVTTPTGKLAVGTGERWCTAHPLIEALPAATRERFERFAALAVASQAAPVVAPVVTPIVTPIVTPRAEVPTASPAPAVEEPTRVAVAERPRTEPARVVSAHVGATPAGPGQAEATRTEPAPTEPARAETTRADTDESQQKPTVTPAQPVIAPPQPVVPPAKPVVAPATAESLYHAAEAALATHDLAAADRALAALVTGFADSPLVDQAIYERARIAYDRHAWADARRQLEKLAERTSSPLAEPGAYLTCRIAVESHDGGAARCLSDYRTAYPSSPHDLDVLGLLVDLAYRDGGCRGAAALIDELVRRHPGTRLAKAWSARCEAQR